ncbi:fimbrial biogenesis chaperone [Niveispirillum irakense]|uniref:fimbrial biogenesis chaperone n=1 Tax=Niveispirillum irakense TaxID=34011 RepID=UPI000420A083|nr:fimbria/pilus periplasmic chaperone [Niveispirillum irakense]
MHAMVRICLFLLALLLISSPASAFRLTPIEMVFDPAGRGATQIFRIENDVQNPIAVEIRIIGRSQDGEGEDVEIPSTDEWIIFPEQIILEPGQNQSVRVQWVGDANPTRELAYRLIAEQLPIDIGQTPQTGGQVRLLVQYKASLYVKPASASPAVTIASAAPHRLSDGTVLELMVRNDGTAHQILTGPTLTVEGGGGKATIAAEALGGLAGENILPGVTRRFLLPWPKDVPVGPVTAQLRLTN